MGSDSEVDEHEHDHHQPTRRERRQKKGVDGKANAKEDACCAPTSGGSKGSKGYNYWAIGLLLLFAVPVVITGILKVSSLFHAHTLGLARS
jgi:hypothetical protein